MEDAEYAGWPAVGGPEAGTPIAEIISEHLFEGLHGCEEEVTGLFFEFWGSGEPVADSLVDRFQEIVLLQVLGNGLVFGFAGAELAEAAADAEVGVDDLGGGRYLAGDGDVPGVELAVVLAIALLAGGEAGGLLLEGVGGLSEEKFEAHFFQLGVETLAGEGAVDVGIVLFGLGKMTADAGDDLRDAAFVEAVNVGDFLMGVVFEGDFFEDGEITGAVFGAAGGGRQG